MYSRGGISLSQRINRFWRSVVIFMTFLGILVSLNQFFYWNLFEISFVNNSFLYIILSLFLPLVFIILPASKRKDTSGVPWYDVLLFGVTIILSIYFGMHGSEIINQGWDYAAPPIATVFSFVFWFIVLE